MSNRSLYITLACALSAWCAGPAYPWGSLENKPTHQLILKQAYSRLEKDPAFRINKHTFPSLEEILKYEGTSFGSLSLDTVGPGPDADGNTFFSNHYYNPSFYDNRPMPGKTPGYAPDMVRSNLASLAASLMKAAPDKDDPPNGKLAAWGAHFLADLFVPFHITGNYYLYINRLNPILDRKVTGLTDALSYRCLTTHGTNFQVEIDLFEEAMKACEKNDWFDPWYYNGAGVDVSGIRLAAAVSDNLKNLIELWNRKVTMMGPTTKTSSHVVWEGSVAHPDNVDLTGFSLKWENPAAGLLEPGTDTAAVKLGEKAQSFAVAAAKTTRIYSSGFIIEPEHALKYAITSVYQAWRSTFSGLYLKTSCKPYVDPQDHSCDNSYELSVQPLNFAGEKAEDVQIALTVINGSLLKKDKYPEVRKIRYIDANDTIDKNVNLQFWYVKPTAKDCVAILEITGRYRETPDLQYRTSVLKIEPASPPTPATPPSPAAEPKDKSSNTNEVVTSPRDGSTITGARFPVSFSYTHASDISYASLCIKAGPPGESINKFRQVSKSTDSITKKGTYNYTLDVDMSKFKPGTYRLIIWGSFWTSYTDTARPVGGITVELKPATDNPPPK